MRNTGWMKYWRSFSLSFLSPWVWCLCPPVLLLCVVAQFLANPSEFSSHNIHGAFLASWKRRSVWLEALCRHGGHPRWSLEGEESSTSRWRRHRAPQNLRMSSRLLAPALPFDLVYFPSDSAFSSSSISTSTCCPGSCLDRFSRVCVSVCVCFRVFELNLIGLEEPISSRCYGRDGMYVVWCRVVFDRVLCLYRVWVHMPILSRRQRRTSKRWLRKWTTYAVCFFSMEVLLKWLGYS